MGGWTAAAALCVGFTAAACGTFLAAEDDGATPTDAADDGGADAAIDGSSTADGGSGGDATVSVHACRERPFGKPVKVGLAGFDEVRAFRPWLAGGIAVGVMETSPPEVFSYGIDPQAIPTTPIVADILPQSDGLARGNHPMLSGDGRTLYLQGSGGTTGDQRIFSLHRDAPGMPFGAAVLVGLIAAAGKSTLEPWIVERKDGTATLYIGYQTTGSDETEDLWRADWNGSSWQAMVPIDELNDATVMDGFTVVTPDELLVVFASARAPSTSVDIWQATRAARTDPWSDVVPIANDEINVAVFADRPSWISDDGCTLYFTRTNAGSSFELFRATR